MRILLVEDHPDTAQVMARCLAALGHTATIARNKAEARALCESQPFHVMFCDIMLPDGDGWPLAGLARRRGIIPIAMTAIAMPADIDRDDDSGFAAHLPKPVNFNVLHDLLTRLMAEPRTEEWVTLKDVG